MNLVRSVALATAGALAAASPAFAQDSDGDHSPAAGADIFYSVDAEDTEVVKAGLNLDWRYRGPQDYQGIRVEKARFAPFGQEGRTFERAYVRLATRTGGWAVSATVGTDGQTVLGSASVHNDKKVRQEYFIEREIVETPIGVSQGIYYTFAGASVDLPVDERNNFNVFAGLQEFTGDNVRLHLRGNYVHVIKPDWGLSAQLRARYFHSSEPGEYDYYSPRWYAQVLPVIQVRRFIGGWQLLGAAGYGAQRDSGRRWRSSRYLDARVTSPAFQRDWALNANFLYSNTPVGTGLAYSYVQFNLGLTKAF